MLINRINVNLLNVPQKDPKHNQLIKFIDEENEECEYDFEDDMVVINLAQARKVGKTTKVSSSIVTEYLFFHEIGHKNDSYWRMLHGSNRVYETLEKEILELSLSRYLKIEQFADNYAKYHRPSYINEKDWEILHNEYSETLNQNCKVSIIELERSIKFRNMPNLCFPIKVQFSDQDIYEIKKKYKISINENGKSEIKILKM